MNFGPEKFGPPPPRPKFVETLLRILVQATVSKGGPGGLPPGLQGHGVQGGVRGACLPVYKGTALRRTRGGTVRGRVSIFL